jgi:hypothetical protein
VSGGLWTNSAAVIHIMVKAIYLIRGTDSNDARAGGPVADDVRQGLCKEASAAAVRDRATPCGLHWTLERDGDQYLVTVA